MAYFPSLFADNMVRNQDIRSPSTAILLGLHKFSEEESKPKTHAGGYDYKMCGKTYQNRCVFEHGDRMSYLNVRTGFKFVKVLHSATNLNF
jgi:hypothetical protein